jgi:hypothetical protein
MTPTGRGDTFVARRPGAGASASGSTPGARAPLSQLPKTLAKFAITQNVPVFRVFVWLPDSAQLSHLWGDFPRAAARNTEIRYVFRDLRNGV